ncbi:MAG: hypothetical protein WD673_04030 [Alphaproteobacteria bacterium]
MAVGETINAQLVLAELVRPAPTALSGNFAALVTGGQILATVLGRDALGRTLVRSDFGAIALAKLVDAPRGSVLTLEVHEVGGRLAVAVRTIAQPGVPEAVRSETSPAFAPPAQSAPAGRVPASDPEVPSRPVFAVVDEVVAPAVRFGAPAPVAVAIAAAGHGIPVAVRGTVFGHDREGRTLIRTDQGTLVVAPLLDLPPGSDVVIEPAPGPIARTVLVTPDAPVPVTAFAAGPAGAVAPEPAGAVAPGPAPQPVHEVAGPKSTGASSPVVVEAILAPRGGAADGLIPWLAPGTRLVASVGAPDGLGRVAITGPFGTLRLAGAPPLAPHALVAIEVVDVGAGLFIDVTPIGTHPPPTLRSRPEPPLPDGAPSGGDPGPPAPPPTIDDIIDIGGWPPLEPLGLIDDLEDLADAPERLAAWPALARVATVLERIAPAHERADFEAKLPKPGPELAHELGAFLVLAAARPSTSDLVGRATADALVAAGYQTEVTALDADLDRLAMPTAEPAGRVFTFPLLTPWGLLLAMLHIGDEGATGGDVESARRFVLELELPRSGRLQLDGLVKATRIDLVLRTPGAMPEGLADRLAAIFHTTCRSNRLNGAITFKVAKEWPFVTGALARGRPAHAVTA